MMSTNVLDSELELLREYVVGHSEVFGAVIARVYDHVVATTRARDRLGLQRIRAIESISTEARRAAFRNSIVAILLQEVDTDPNHKQLTDDSLRILRGLEHTSISDLGRWIQRLYISDIGGALLGRGETDYETAVLTQLIRRVLVKAGMDSDRDQFYISPVTGMKRISPYKGTILRELCISPLSHLNLIHELYKRPRLLSVHSMLKKLSIDISLHNSTSTKVQHTELPDVAMFASSLPHLDSLQVIGAGAGAGEVWALQVCSKLVRIKSICLHVLQVEGFPPVTLNGPHGIDNVKDLFQVSYNGAFTEETYSDMQREAAKSEVLDVYRSCWAGIESLPILVGFTISNPTVIGTGEMIWEALKSKNLFRLGLLHPQIHFNNVHGVEARRGDTSGTTNSEDIESFWARKIRRWENTPEIEYFEWGSGWDIVVDLFSEEERFEEEDVEEDKIDGELPPRSEWSRIKGVMLDFDMERGPIGEEEGTGLHNPLTDPDPETGEVPQDPFLDETTNLFKTLRKAKMLSIGNNMRPANFFNWESYREDNTPVSKMELDGPYLETIDPIRAAGRVMKDVEAISIVFKQHDSRYLSQVLGIDERVDQCAFPKLKFVHLRTRILDTSKTTVEGWLQPDDFGNRAKRRGWYIRNVLHRIEAQNTARVAAGATRIEKVFIGCGNHFWAWRRYEDTQNQITRWEGIDNTAADNDYPWLATKNWQDMLWPPMRAPFAHTDDYEDRAEEAEDDYKLAILAKRAEEEKRKEAEMAEKLRKLEKEHNERDKLQARQAAEREARNTHLAQSGIRASRPIDPDEEYDEPSLHSTPEKLTSRSVAVQYPSPIGNDRNSQDLDIIMADFQTQTQHAYTQTTQTPEEPQISSHTRNPPRPIPSREPQRTQNRSITMTIAENANRLATLLEERMARIGVPLLSFDEDKSEGYDDTSGEGEGDDYDDDGNGSGEESKAASDDPDSQSTDSSDGSFSQDQASSDDSDDMGTDGLNSNAKGGNSDNLSSENTPGHHESPPADSGPGHHGTNDRNGGSDIDEAQDIPASRSTSHEQVSPGKAATILSGLMKQQRLTDLDQPPLEEVNMEQDVHKPSTTTDEDVEMVTEPEKAQEYTEVHLLDVSRAKRKRDGDEDEEGGRQQFGQPVMGVRKKARVRSRDSDELLQFEARSSYEVMDNWHVR